METDVTLYIVRHAWAEERGTDWPDDARRPLSALGSDRWAGICQVLTERGVSPTVIATSPFLRCRQTAGILVDAMDSTPDIVDLDDLAPDSDLDAILEWTSRQVSDEHREIAWVGHSPDVDEMTATLIGADGRLRFAKGAVAMLRFSDPVRVGGAELRWLLSAKLLGC